MNACFPIDVTLDGMATSPEQSVFPVTTFESIVMNPVAVAEPSIVVRHSTVPLVPSYGKACAGLIAKLVSAKIRVVTEVINRVASLRILKITFY
jgi:hypothetical protein